MLSAMFYVHKILVVVYVYDDLCQKKAFHCSNKVTIKEKINGSSKWAPSAQKIIAFVFSQLITT